MSSFSEEPMWNAAPSCHLHRRTDAGRGIRPKRRTTGERDAEERDSDGEHDRRLPECGGSDQADLADHVSALGHRRARQPLERAVVLDHVLAGCGPIFLVERLLNQLLVGELQALAVAAELAGFANTGARPAFRPG